MPTVSVDIETEIDVEIQVWCSCGSGLCGQSTAQNAGRYSEAGVIVEPCEKCLDNKREEGYDVGYETGYNDAGPDD